MMASKTGYSMGSFFTTVSGEGQPQSYFNISYLLLLHFYWRIFLEKEKLKQLIK
jgi:hypothetical protein